MVRGWCWTDYDWPVYAHDIEPEPAYKDHTYFACNFPGIGRHRHISHENFVIKQYLCALWMNV